MAATLLMRAPDELRSELPLRATNTLGRAPDQDINLYDEQASRQHAAIAWADGSYWLQDRNSTNGTYLNGQLLRGPTLLLDGDVIVMGETTILFSETCKRALWTFDEEWDHGVERRNPPAERMSRIEHASISDRSSSGSVNE